MVQQTIHLSPRCSQTESQLHPNHWESRTNLTNRVFRPMKPLRSQVQPVPSLTLVILTVVAFFSIVNSRHTVRADNNSTVSTSYVRLEDSSSEAAGRRTDKVAEVTRFSISPSSSDSIPVLGVRAWEPTVGGRHRGTFFVASSPQCSNNTV